MRGLIQGMECLAPACRGANLTPKLFENRPRVIDQKPFVVHHQGTTRHDHLTSRFSGQMPPLFALKRFNHPMRSRFPGERVTELESTAYDADEARS
jgi:hypothetical protein